MVERKRSYKPGHRNGKDYSKNLGQLSRSRWAWVKIYFGQFVIWADYRKDEEGNETDEVLDIKLLVPVPNRQPLAWNLTASTEEELVAFKHLVDTAIEWALPIARQRDKEAADALDAGDDSHSRIYRQVPQLVYRKGPESQYGQGVHNRPEDADAVPSGDGDLDGGLRVPGADVAERDASDGKPEDDWPKVDQPPSIRPVGEVGDGAS